MAFFQSGDKEIVVDDDTVEPYESPLAHQKSYDDFSAVQEPKARQGRVYRLQPAVKQYAWGIRGGDSRVARYGLETGALKTIDQSAPYAEIWLGTHPSGPSLLDDGTELSKVVKGGNLPWLLKVLSAGKALSIQAHPDKSLAEKLHKDKPDLYKDSNHKPEMAIALTPFEAMCGFRRLSEIAVHLRKHPEFAACISTEAQLAVFTAGPRDSKAQKLALHKVFESFMVSDSASAFCLQLDTRRGGLLDGVAWILPHRHAIAATSTRRLTGHATQACEPDVSSAQLKLLVQRLRREQRAQFRPSGAQHINPAAPVLSPGSAAKDDEVPESAWERKAARAILRLEEQFPGDVGAMAPLFLNYLLIAPGESFFMAANEPHAYVAGEILECMACSDNVVRAGLTPKMKDVDNLVDMLTYSMGGPDIEFGRLVHQGPGTRTLCYTPPVPEFEVLITTVETGATYDIAPCEVPSILICVEGIGHTQSAPGPDGVEPQRKHRYELCPGKSLYITAGTVALTLVNDMTTKGPLRVARARQNLSLAGRAEDSQ